MTTRLVLLALALALPPVAAPAAPPASPPTSSTAAFPYRLATEPERPSPGESFTITLEVEGLSGAVLGQVKASAGFDLGVSFARPFVGKDGKARGSLMSLEFRVSGPGPWNIDRLEIKGREGNLVLGPLHFEARVQADPGNSGTARRTAAWTWVAPPRVYRHSSFALSLEPAPGGAAPAGVAQASFPPPEGGSLEALPGPGLSWTATTLDAGSMDLPQARIEAGALSGKAPPLRIEVLPLPVEIAASRAIGDFSLDLEVPPQAIVREGDSLVFRLVLEGRGNLPSINFPRPRFSLNGRNLAPDLVSQRRRDSIRAVVGGYQGSLILELALGAPGPGTLGLEVPAMTVLQPSGDFASLGPFSAEVRILPSSAKAGAASPDPFASRIGGLSKAVAGLDQGLATLPALVAKARYTQALALLAASPVGVKTSAESRSLEACLLWVKGEKGRALGIVYGLARRHEGGAPVSALAREASALVGGGKSATKVLPRALFVLVPAAALFVAFLVFFLAGSRAPRSGARRPLLKGAAGLCLLSALGLCLLAGASLLEDRAEYAVIWTDTLVSIPSPLAEGREIVLKGSSARVIGDSPDYVGLRLEDGRVGWAPRESVFPY